MPKNSSQSKHDELCIPLTCPVSNGRLEYMKATISISLPDDLRSWVEEQVSLDNGLTPSEFIRDVLRSEQRRRARAKVEELLLEGLNSGPATPMTAKDWDDIRRESRGSWGHCD
jgi:antitoxin ParD1/3/4